MFSLPGAQLEAQKLDLIKYIVGKIRHSILSDFDTNPKTGKSF